MKDILIYGAGGFGLEVTWLIADINHTTPTWNLLGYLDDDLEKIGREFVGHRVVGCKDWLSENPAKPHVAIAIGDPAIRAQVASYLGETHVDCPALIHPSVQMSRSVTIEEGTIISAGTIMTVNVDVARHVHIDTSCTVGHGAKIGPFCRLNPGVHVSGDVKLSRNVYVGSGAVIMQGISVGENTVIGAGAVVAHDFPEDVVAVGVPARIIRSTKVQRPKLEARERK